MNNDEIMTLSTRINFQRDTASKRYLKRDTRWRVLALILFWVAVGAAWLS